MISNANIGTDGRLGNQLFQYSSIFGLCKKNNYKYCLPLNQTNLDYFNITVDNCDISKLNLPIHYEKDYFHKENIFDKPDNVSYIGFFQNYNYFDYCKEFIKQELSFKPNTLIDEVDQWFHNKLLVSIHIRRTDYRYYQHFFYQPSLSWYLASMKFFPDQQFIVFSDDKPWCQKSFRNIKNVIISPFKHYIQDLYAMTKCIGHIISNSTFSWWGAYLSNSNTVIMPHKWGDKTNWFQTCCDFSPQSWIKFNDSEPFFQVFETKL